MRQIFLDTETTGLSAADGHRIIEIAGIEYINRRPTGHRYHQYLHPERTIEADALAVHGITEAFLADKPKFCDIADALLAFLTDAELVIHNAPFDVSFLNHEFTSLGPRFELITHHCSILDTLVLARKKHPGQQNNLDALCRRYHVDRSARDLHGALVDANLLAQVYLAMTGGQTHLFVEEESQNRPTAEVPLAAENTDAQETEMAALIVIDANEQEIKAHTEQLKNIRENNGVCLWV